MRLFIRKMEGRDQFSCGSALNVSQITNSIVLSCPRQMLHNNVPHFILRLYFGRETTKNMATFIVIKTRTFIIKMKLETLSYKI